MADEEISAWDEASGEAVDQFCLSGVIEIDHHISAENNIKFWQIILSGATTCGFIGAMIADESASKYIGAIVSFILIMLNILFRIIRISKDEEASKNKCFYVKFNSHYLHILLQY